MNEKCSDETFFEEDEDGIWVKIMLTADGLVFRASNENGNVVGITILPDHLEDITKRIQAIQQTVNQ